MKRDTPAWRRYLTFWGEDAGADVDAEFEFHLQEREEELLAAGLPPDEARAAALRGFGNIPAVRAECRELLEDRNRVQRRQAVFGVFWQDVTYALRQMRAQKLLTAAALLTLTVAIGATTSLFSVVYSVLLRPLPFADGERVVTLWETVGDFPRGRVSPGHFHTWTEESRSFTATAAAVQRSYNLTEDGSPERVIASAVSTDFFRVFDLAPLHGRYFAARDEGTDAVVLSEQLWRGRYGADASLVGRTVSLSGTPHLVLGVAPHRMRLTEDDALLWTLLPFPPDARTNFGSHGWLMYGRLAPGVTLAQARADVATITERIRERVPENMQQRASNVESFMESLTGSVRTQLLVLLGAVAFVLLIACANVASLLLARATARRKELAIRAAIGSGRGRIVRQLLTESVVLAVIGGAGGVLFAQFGIRMLLASAPRNVPRLHEATLDLPVLGFALLAMLVCGIVFGLAPAWRAARADLQAVLREGGRAAVPSVARDRMRNVLITGEIAVALVLLVGAALFVRSARALHDVPLGFEARDITTANITLPAGSYPDALALHTAFARVLDELAAQPGIDAVAVSNRAPMSGMSVDIGLEVAGRAEPPLVGAHLRLVSEQYFELLNVPIRRGRALTAADLQRGAAPVVVINEALADAVFPGEDPIGQRVSGWAADGPEWREVVGVAANARTFGREREAAPEIYIPYPHAPAGALDLSRTTTLMVRGDVSPANAGATLRSAVAAVDPQLPIYNVQSLERIVALNSAPQRFSMLLLSLLGLAGLVLAAVGIYGVIGFFVTQRAHEMGVRLALGASRSDVLRLVMLQGARLAGAGLAIGAIAALLVTRVLESLLFQVTPLDLSAYVGAVVVLGGTALAAAFLPAVRAARVEPARTLRGG